MLYKNTNICISIYLSCMHFQVSTYLSYTSTCIYIYLSIVHECACINLSIMYTSLYITCAVILAEGQEKQQRLYLSISHAISRIFHIFSIMFLSIFLSLSFPDILTCITLSLSLSLSSYIFWKIFLSLFTVFAAFVLQNWPWAKIS